MIPVLPVKKWRQSGQERMPYLSEGSQFVIFEECSFLSLLVLVIPSYAEGSPVAESTSLGVREMRVQGSTLHPLSSCAVVCREVPNSGLSKVFAYFRGVNTPTIADLKLPWNIWCCHGMFC